MIKQLATEISDLASRIDNLEAVHTDILWRQKELLCAQFLFKHFDSKVYIPNTIMSMSPVTICHILNDILLNKRESVIEFGSGNSTIFIADLLSRIDRKVTFFSIDDNDDWLMNVHNMLSQCKIDQFVKLVHSPIVPDQLFESDLVSKFNWYDTNSLTTAINDNTFDLIIVDGPQGRVSPYSRFPAFPFVSANLKNSYTVVLDDSDRNDEQQIISVWTEQTNGGKLYMDHKYAAITKNSPYFAFAK